MTQRGLFPGFDHQRKADDQLDQIKHRDHALSLLEQHRADLIQRGRQIALELCRRNGSVTSPEVLDQLRAEMPDKVDEVDPRFMGPVFSGDGWERSGYVPQGSHARPVSVWKLKE